MVFRGRCRWPLHSRSIELCISRHLDLCTARPRTTSHTLDLYTGPGMETLRAFFLTGCFQILRMCPVLLHVFSIGSGEAVDRPSHKIAGTGTLFHGDDE